MTPGAFVNLFRYRKRTVGELNELVGKDNAEKLLLAIDKDLPIMICESKKENPIDGILYGILKRLGARTVKNIDNESSGEKPINGIYLTVYSQYRG